MSVKIPKMTVSAHVGVVSGVTHYSRPSDYSKFTSCMKSSAALWLVTLAVHIESSCC